jgi:N-acyl amino acid synthase of PEP-CTERM/exosortase system
MTATAIFQARTIDDDPHLLKASYRLRYQVYCVERGFLPAANYPTEQEVDEFDRYSAHVGVVDSCGELAGTARLVSPSSAGLPMLRYCTFFPGEGAVLVDPANTVVEVSRLSISRHYSRRADDPFCRTPAPAGSTECPAAVTGRRRGRNEVFVTLLKAIYQAAKRARATHWIAVTEPSLQRRVGEYGFPFRMVGPESDYSGRVNPYIMALAEFDQVILSRQVAALYDFLIGLEPEFQPRLESHASTGVAATSGISTKHEVPV